MRGAERPKCTEGLLANGCATSPESNYPAKRTRFETRREEEKRQGGFDEGQTDGNGTLLVPGTAPVSRVCQ